MTTATPATNDALVIAQEWISEHYFFSEAKSESFVARVLARRREWDAADGATPRSRIAADRQSLLNRFATLSENTDPEAVTALDDHLAELLGYHETGLRSERVGPVTFVRAAGLAEPAIALVNARSVATTEMLLDKEANTLTVPFVLPDGDELTTVPRLISYLFVGHSARPAFTLVLAGGRLLLAERERWPEGRFLAVDLQLVLERWDNRRGGEVDRALACVAADSVAPDAEGEIWWSQTLEQSVRHTVGVSQELRDGVRLSIEIIAGEVVARRAEQGLEPLGASEAQPLALQALRFLYRILFLLYAEASPQLGVLPVGAPEYEQGYSLDRLRDLALVELTDPRARSGTHLYDSLAVLFALVDRGHEPPAAPTVHGASDGLVFRSLRADLFHPRATALIDEVRLGNAKLQEVLRHLLVSRGSAARGAGFISYAELGINQLGAVYEGLMSYTGFFAEDDLYEVAKDGDSEKGSWVVPVARAGGIAECDFVRITDPVTGERVPVVHPRGSFVFRLAGRERQQSASYYTPEVLTRFVVSQALEELFDPDGQTTSAEHILALTVCEPALGSGAFVIEAVRQLAEEYVRRRQDELGETIDPDAYPQELARVKAYLALHQVYGVDLNATAVELAEISLWLDTMVEGLAAPWFGLHLRRGNSLIGARRAVYSQAQAADRSWLRATPTPVGDDGVGEIAGRIPHFLLPAEGWGAAADVQKTIRELAPDAVTALKDWRKQFRRKLTKGQVDALVDMGRRVERLWEIAERRLAIADRQIRREIPVWGMAETVREPASDGERAVSREEIKTALADSEGAYRRLRRLMDAWCALWFWPLTEQEVAPPTLDEWLDAARLLLGQHAHKRRCRSVRHTPAPPILTITSWGWSGRDPGPRRARVGSCTRAVGRPSSLLLAGGGRHDPVALRPRNWLAGQSWARGRGSARGRSCVEVEADRLGHRVRRARQHVAGGALAPVQRRAAVHDDLAADQLGPAGPAHAVAARVRRVRARGKRGGEDRLAERVDVELGVAAVEAHGDPAVHVGEVERVGIGGAGHEQLAVDCVLGDARLLERRGDLVHQRLGTAHEPLVDAIAAGLRERCHLGDVEPALAAHVAGRLPRHDEVQLEAVGVGGGEILDLRQEHRGFARPVAVDEHDPAARLRGQDARADRQQRRYPAADGHDRVALVVGGVEHGDEAPRRSHHPQAVARRQPFGGKAREGALGDPLDGDAEPARSRRHADGVGAPDLLALVVVDDDDVLAGLEAVLAGQLGRHRALDHHRVIGERDDVGDGQRVDCPAPGGAGAERRRLGLVAGKEGHPPEPVDRVPGPQSAEAPICPPGTARTRVRQRLDAHFGLASRIGRRTQVGATTAVVERDW